ncbi:unnamed protein product, partial [Staurois parvus]
MEAGRSTACTTSISSDPAVPILLKKPYPKGPGMSLCQGRWNSQDIILPCTMQRGYDRGEYDPITEMEQKSRKYNVIDGLYDFRSCCGIYTVKDGLPLNPKGRTGLRGIGSLRWFGPNHSLHPVLTRWSTGSASGPNQTASKNILEVLVVRWKGNELWSLPGGMLDPGQKVPIRFKKLLEHTDLSEFLALLDSGTKVFRGYLDDPRNTDNAWIETLAVNIHLDTKENLDKLLQNLKKSDKNITLRWQLLEQKIPLLRQREGDSPEDSRAPPCSLL